jgi:hypothetical protein
MKLAGGDSCAFPAMNSKVLYPIPWRGRVPAEGTSLLPATELRVLQEYRPNLMIVGGGSSIESVLLGLQPGFAHPVTVRQAGPLLALPSAGGTLVLRNVSDLTATEQYALFRWLDRDRHRTQVISASTRPLMPLLEQGVFSDSLYYQLNTMYLELPAEFLYEAPCGDVRMS